MAQPENKKQKLNAPSAEEVKDVEYLRSLPSIRDRCQKILELGKKNELDNFKVDLDKINDVVTYVKDLMAKNFPDGVDSVPFHARWRHFEPGNPNRVEEMCASWKCDKFEKARRLIDLVVVSVLLDAGAGASWKFKEPKTEDYYTRSEGLGIASFHMFLNGSFSSAASNPHQSDAEGLSSLPDDCISKGFQVDQSNPLVGCEGRTSLLKKLGHCLKDKKQFFGSKDGSSIRPGNLVDYLLSKTNSEQELDIEVLWAAVIEGLEDIWPDGRTKLGGSNMGDVWKHSKLPADSQSSNLVPFHKLSQWLTYSLMEPLQEAGFKIKKLGLMTGLPEYRNGGLLIDLKVLVPKSPSILTEKIHPFDEIVVEWRALTVAILDLIHQEMLKVFGTTSEEFPLVKMLEGGTWKAGRLLAKDLRDGTPPITIVSDGTVF